MDSIQLKLIIKRLLKIRSLAFVGIFPKDKIPLSINHYPYCFIANTEISYSSGKHWVVFYYHSEYLLEFFDSLGHSPNFYNFPIESKVICTSLHSPIQSSNSNLCALFCLYYLYCKSKSKSFSCITSLFSSMNLQINDYHLRSFFKRLNLI